MIKNGRPYMEGDSRLLTDEPVSTQNIVKGWIQKYILPTEKTFHLGCSSYVLKHILEQDTGIYLTNNQFKDAMLLCGYEPKDPDVRNWYFRISRRSPAFKHETVFPRGLCGVIMGYGC